MSAAGPGGADGFTIRRWTMSPASVQGAYVPLDDLRPRPCSPTTTCTYAPDDDDRPPERSAFTTENVERYVAAAEDAGIDELGCSEHVYRFTEALEIWQHPFWQQQARDDLDAYCEFVRTTPLRLGLEVDFVPGAEDRIANLLDGHDLDYVVGSIHFVGDRAVDDDGYDIWEAEGDADAVWRRYFETLAEAAGSGLFDILAHPDLVKMWGGPGPFRSAIRGSTTSPPWRRSPSRESRSRSRPPACESRWGRSTRRRRSRRCASRRGRSFALSSDAHVAADVGHAYDDAVSEMARLGDRADRRLRAPRAPAGAAGMSDAGARVGIGYDAHRFAAGRRLVLGGVEIPHERRPGRPFRRRRPHPRRDRRRARGRRARRHRNAVPARRGALARRPLPRPADG